MPFFMYLIAIGLGAAVGFIVAGVLKGQLKTVRRQSGAGSYVRHGSLVLTHSADHYLYSNMTRTPRSKSNNRS